MLSVARGGRLIISPGSAATQPYRRAARRAIRCVANGDSNKEPSDRDALLKSLGQISKTTGRTANSNNVVLGGDTSVESWKELDEKVNEYPCQRSFKCVGVAEDGFRDQMVLCVEDVIGTQVHPESINIRPSSKGNYISVQIGPVIVKTPDQVLAIFANMKRDDRLKWVM
mmetsp:Transcript_7487/g.13497  ORF Transcript_7487/g.13497 Transcript_7487/m.13497 type:complete len:170 (-) Transcript_7487:199-708(-)